MVVPSCGPPWFVAGTASRQGPDVSSKLITERLLTEKGWFRGL